MSDKRPSIAELQHVIEQLASEDSDPHHAYDALLAAAEALPALLEIAKSATEWQRAVRERVRYGSGTYVNNPFDITSPEFRAEASRLDAVADGLLSEFLLALAKVRP